MLPTIPKLQLIGVFTDKPSAKAYIKLSDATKQRGFWIISALNLPPHHGKPEQTVYLVLFGSYHNQFDAKFLAKMKQEASHMTKIEES